jgi:diguanylate cyclase (GGDEF)-like protein
MLQIGFIIFTESRRNRLHARQNRYFIWMLIITLFSFVGNILCSIQTDSAWLFPFVVAGNYMELSLNTILLPIFFLYVCDQVFQLNEKLKRNLSFVLWAMAAICIAMSISTIFTGQFFYFDEANVYHRGPLFVLPMMILFAMMVIVEIFLISQKKKIEPHYYKPLMFLLLSPLIGWVLQLFIYGLPFSLLGITFAGLILFATNQNRNIDEDYLTGVFNRQKLDYCLQKKINASTENKTFSAILIDVDNFKCINDHFGHTEGDKALINAAFVLRDTLKITDFIARYGGDEFCIILDSDDPKTVESTIDQINKHLLDFNKQENKPYQLSFSFGYAVYQLSMGDNAETFFRIIDRKMYQQKNAKKAEECSTEQSDAIA